MTSPIRVGPDPHDAHDIVFFRRHVKDDPSQTVPGRLALNSWPGTVRVTVRAVLSEVAAAPPYRYRGGGYWEAMHGDMAGIYEIRVSGPSRRQYRLFCIIDSQVAGADRPYLTVIAGLDKPFMTKFSGHDYADIRALRDEYLSRRLRSFDD